jgi:hypothetical protein
VLKVEGGITLCDLPIIKPDITKTNLLKEEDQLIEEEN